MGDLKLGLQLGYWTKGCPGNSQAELAIEAERLGFDSVWTGESWGSDVFTPLAWIGAQTERIRLGTSVVQMSARTPTATAMHALTLDYLSGGRMILGLGVSGPQVVEGWYGQAFSKPLARTREYVDIIRQVLRREGPVSCDGEHYPLPYRGDNGWGMGKPLRTNTAVLRPELPIFIGAEGPKNVTQTVEIADGWLPLYYSPYRESVYKDQLKNASNDFEITAMAMVNVDDNVQQALAPVKGMLGFYVGGMGSKKRNFHKELMARMGFEEEANRIQELFLQGDREAAIAAVPDAFADEISLSGPLPRIAEKIQDWKRSRVTTLNIFGDKQLLRAMAEMVL
ncbi:LLM class F420-dependent oxidoreductase [Pseudomaricurvus alkylphenolicus]|jgi:F420-dependent oxidoreductase-like protein|uniref:LLM class F420-dependent oxidoreductase n=1 Tax=Pseudomaricurvus alkylphenolicus TaxID=1306991 RepID=UPI00141DDC72|nr:LLM class F420-dependent oxidoreductase [Pseudomaricurvus alkylphenolicus]NIB42126.1 LLM class F420-dependent oxidoreductase [Pseudomaricurvus alkylphenolicus]